MNKREKRRDMRNNLNILSSSLDIWPASSKRDISGRFSSKISEAFAFFELFAEEILSLNFESWQRSPLFESDGGISLAIRAICFCIFCCLCYYCCYYYCYYCYYYYYYYYFGIKIIMKWKEYICIYLCKKKKNAIDQS